jgi:hypothetical protein
MLPLNVKGENSSVKIMRALADEAPLTVYAIARKSGVAVSFVHKVVKQPKLGLEAQNIVKVLSARTWRTGLERVEYILTFRGLMEYFNLTFAERKTRATLGTKKAIQKYRQFYDYPVFTEIDYLEAWLGSEVYDFICSAAWMVKNHPLSIPIVTDTVSGPLTTIIQNIMERKPRLSLQTEERVLMHAFTLVFFDLATLASQQEKTDIMPNKALYKLANETYKEVREAMKQRLRDVAKLEDGLKKRFGTQLCQHTLATRKA